jgi:hypothetical protein
MTFAALVSAGFILGLMFNAYGVLGLSLVVVPVYFAGSLHLGLPQAAAWTLLAAAIFQFGCFCGFAAQDELLRRFASAPGSALAWRDGRVFGLHTRMALLLARLWSSFGARATRLLGDAKRPWNGSL